MSDDEFDADGFGTTPNYEKLRGMGFICWREIPATGDQVCYSDFSSTNRIPMFLSTKDNDDAQVKKSTKKNKRKIDAVETEQENETPTESSVWILVDAFVRSSTI